MSFIVTFGGRNMVPTASPPFLIFFAKDKAASATPANFSRRKLLFHKQRCRGCAVQRTKSPNTARQSRRSCHCSTKPDLLLSLSERKRLPGHQIFRMRAPVKVTISIPLPAESSCVTLCARTFPNASWGNGTPSSSSPLGSTASVGRLATYRYRFSSPAAYPIGSRTMNSPSVGLYSRARS